MYTSGGLQQQMAGLAINDQLETKVELYISCAGLKNKDLLSKSDPTCVVKIGERQQSGEVFWSDIGRTEVQKDNLNPKFVKTFIVPYKFEEIQPLKFLVYDIDNGTSSLDDDDFLGCCEVKLSDVVCGINGCITRKLTALNGDTSKDLGTITIRSEQKSKIRDPIYTFELDGRDLAKKDFFGKSDPYFILAKKIGNEFVDIYKSEIIMNNLNPVWKGFSLPMQKLCNGDINSPIRIQVFDWDRNSDPDFIGSAETTLAQLEQIYRDRQSISLIDDGSYHKKKKTPKNTGKIQVRGLRSVLPEEEFTFLDYLGGGLEVSLLVAIDFTASNGNPNDPNSLHCGGKMNEYEMAIRSIGDILAYYDSDKLFPTYGFGAKLPGGTVSHCFALNGNPNNPNSIGVDGILRDYRQALNNVELYGPTNFAPTIQNAISFAAQASLEQSQQNQKYLILLIITDGAITDMSDTVREIVKASNYPLSIVIVGVGTANFDSMETLDGDDRRLSSGSQVASRDIVQFVPFRKFNSQNYQLLARETLKEVPGQVCEYFKNMKIKPNKRL